MGEAQKKGFRYEKYRARKMGAKHIGGPKPMDALKGRRKIEIKKWKSPVHKGILTKAVRRGIKTIISPSGFTRPAKEYARKRNIRLRK